MWGFDGARHVSTYKFTVTIAIRRTAVVRTIFSMAVHYFNFLWVHCCVARLPLVKGSVVVGPVFHRATNIQCVRQCVRVLY